MQFQLFSWRAEQNSSIKKHIPDSFLAALVAFDIFCPKLMLEFADVISDKITS
jgi:hypothetical protein